MHHIYLLVNGEIATDAYSGFKKRIAWFDHSVQIRTVIAADGGLRHAASLGLEPDYLVGDMDSATDVQNQLSASAKILSYPTEKDETDLELALQLAHRLLRQDRDGAIQNELSPHRIVLLGALGARLDMTMANVLLLANSDFLGLHIELWSTLETAQVLRPPSAELRGAVGSRISLIALGKVNAVQSSGLYYPLKKEALHFASPRGLSNQFLQESATLTWQSGMILCVQEFDFEADKPL